MRLLSTATLLIFAIPALSAEPKVLRDVPYTDTKHERQTLDVYFSPEGKNRPIIFWIHGGGWQAGDKKDVDLKPQACVDHGFVFVSVNYRLLKDGVTIKQMAEDVAKGLKWVHDHAKELGGDSSRFIITGHSAGAQLAALICTDDRYLKAEKLPLSIVKGCVPVDGDTYDVPMQIATVPERTANIYRKKFGDETQQKDLSAVTHVALGKTIPPVLVLHVADHPEVKGQSERLVKVLTDAKFPAKTYPATEKTHTTINSELGKPGDKPTEAMFGFIDEVLNRRTVERFKSQLDRSMTPTVAVDRFGPPDRDIGSGLMIYEYGLEDGSRIRLGFPGLAKILYAKHETANGTVVDLLAK